MTFFKEKEQSLKLLRSAQETTLLIFSISSAVILSVYALVSLYLGDNSLAIHHATVSCISIFVLCRVWFFRDIKCSGFMLSTLYVMSSTTLVYLGGIDLVFWVYPAFLTPFFMTTTRLATLLCVLGGLLLLPKLFMLLEPSVLFRAIFALLVNVLFGVTIAIANNRHRSDLERKVKTDGLTGVPNRRALDEALVTLTSMPITHRPEHHVLMMDLDHFKALNDRFGHAEGDLALTAVAQLIEEYLDGTGSIYRYGGEEFTVILQADWKTSVDLADDLRELVERECFAAHTITTSIGVAKLRDTDSGDSVLARADAALSSAKSRGRNCVMLSPDDYDRNSVKVVA